MRREIKNYELLVWSCILALEMAVRVDRNFLILKLWRRNQKCFYVLLKIELRNIITNQSKINLQIKFMDQTNRILTKIEIMFSLGKFWRSRIKLHFFFVFQR